LHKTEADKVWNFFPVHAPKQVKAFFLVGIVLVGQMATWTKIGSITTLFVRCNSP